MTGCSDPWGRQLHRIQVVLLAQLLGQGVVDPSHLRLRLPALYRRALDLAQGVFLERAEPPVVLQTERLYDFEKHDRPDDTLRAAASVRPIDLTVIRTTRPDPGRGRAFFRRGVFSRGFGADAGVAGTFAMRAAAMAAARSSPNTCRSRASTSLPRPSRTIVSSRAFSSAPRSSANCEGASMSAIRLRACSPTARGMDLCCFSSRTSRRCFPGRGSIVSAQWTTQADTDIRAWAAPDRTSAHSSSVAEIVCSVPFLRTRGLFMTPALLRRAAESAPLHAAPA